MEQTTASDTTRLNKFRQLARCFFYINCQMEWSSGALVAMNLYSPYEKLAKQPNQKWQLRFCEDFVDFIYQTKEKAIKIMNILNDYKQILLIKV